MHQLAVDGDEARLLHLAGALQRGSEHPLARAVLQACAERGLVPAEAAALRALPGRGIEGDLDGQRLQLGSRRLLDEAGLAAGALEERARTWEAEGRTLSWLIEQGQPARVLGLLAFGDSLKAGAAAAVSACGVAW